MLFGILVREPRGRIRHECKRGRVCPCESCLPVPASRSPSSCPGPCGGSRGQGGTQGVQEGGVNNMKPHEIKEKERRM